MNQINLNNLSTERTRDGNGFYMKTKPTLDAVIDWLAAEYGASKSGVIERLLLEKYQELTSNQ